MEDKKERKAQSPQLQPQPVQTILCQETVNPFNQSETLDLDLAPLWTKPISPALPSTPIPLNPISLIKGKKKVRARIITFDVTYIHRETVD